MTTTLGGVSTPQTYAQASRGLLRTTLLDGLRDLLTERDWSKVTMADVARHVGVSRQTVYNEFGSRHGLAQAYALRLVDRYTGEIADAVDAMPGDIDGALTTGITRFLVAAAADPMIASLVGGGPNPDLHRLVTTEAAPLIAAAKARLSAILRESWVNADADSADRIGGAVARMALSYVAMPPEVPVDQVAANLTSIFGPAVREATR
ncbi:MAG: TetR family transcriptional regulator [Gordonia sp. (in: high G+C Gram-positive bacteria)]|uniref:TetR/AcrR family transcriptional regulator n=1 Tax=Gordonia sp. (in: high G+C Gram-positive bacteria) TaxID=84139 RepID=UPI0039E622C1